VVPVAELVAFLVVDRAVVQELLDVGAATSRCLPPPAGTKAFFRVHNIRTANRNSTRARDVSEQHLRIDGGINVTLGRFRRALRVGFALRRKSHDRAP
jgi:hypothetical protein